MLTAGPLRCVNTVETLLGVTRLRNDRGLASSTVTTPGLALGNLHIGYGVPTSPSWCANVGGTFGE